MSIQNFCKYFRTNILNISLVEMERITGVKHKTISAFEHGRSNNINHLSLYITACSTDEQRTQFNVLLINEINKGL